MTASLRLALVQANPTVGDLAGNAALVRHHRAEAARNGADAVAFSEMFLAGYPPEDLVRHPGFLRRAAETVRALAEETADGGPALIIGAPWEKPGGRLWNAAVVADGGAITAVRGKRALPNHGVFDERRVFNAAGGPMAPVTVRSASLGLMVCEDMWTPRVTAGLARAGAAILLCLNGSPFHDGHCANRLARARARVAESGLPLIYLNQVGGQDDLVFDGASFVLNRNGTMAAGLPHFHAGHAVTRWTREADGWACAAGDVAPPPDRPTGLYHGMVTGLRDYAAKNRMPGGIVLGLSGGIDSALSAAVAVDALGADAVRAVMMPSPHTSAASLEDAAETARRLGIRLDSAPITPLMGVFDDALAPVLGRPPAGVTAENIQARARGAMLMAVANATGAMVLTTGNKSEMAVGYATLYGDMCGGFSVLKDVYKTDVTALARWRNNVADPAAHGWRGPAGAVIPDRTITRPPTAELSPNQRDDDTLPPYGTLDGILRGLVEDGLSVADVARRGYDPATVARVRRMLDGAEHKRRQAPPGVRLTPRALGRERRWPITHRFGDGVA